MQALAESAKEINLRNGKRRNRWNEAMTVHGVQPISHETASLGCHYMKYENAETRKTKLTKLY